MSEMKRKKRWPIALIIIAAVIIASAAIISSYRDAPGKIGKEEEGDRQYQSRPGFCGPRCGGTGPECE